MQLCKLALPHHRKVLQLCVAISIAESRPRDKMGAGGVHPDPQMGGRGSGVSKKQIFSVLGTSVWSKSKGEGGRGPRAPSLDPPLISSLLTLDFKPLNLGSFLLLRCTLQPCQSIITHWSLSVQGSIILTLFRRVKIRPFPSYKNLHFQRAKPFL